MTIGEAAKLAKKAICWAAYGASECGDYVSVYHVARYRWSKVISADNMIEWQKAHIRRDKDGRFPMVTISLSQKNSATNQYFVGELGKKIREEAIDEGRRKNPENRSQIRVQSSVFRVGRQLA
ncbi:OLC1v1013552C1 [Oldenlandia corymbosa var. corymbosa]|uniref:OLC1v1013552C1 n=1 Tax=Oldenlandia corymbosa var. corymbosa TaxID=529605 RepID=A0AAV1E253_OLDCO|nr:OLC1v1013552C1 [Oldenlandia corymbosa var. corymbosa]